MDALWHALEKLALTTPATLSDYTRDTLGKVIHTYPKRPRILVADIVVSQMSGFVFSRAHVFVFCPRCTTGLKLSITGIAIQ